MGTERRNPGLPAPFSASAGRFFLWFFAFFFLMAGAQVAFSPKTDRELAFRPGPSEDVPQDVKERLRAERALRILDAANPPAEISAPAASPLPRLASAAQLVVMALPAERGIPDKFHRLLEKVAYSPAMARVALPLRVAVDYGRAEPRGTFAADTVTVAALGDAAEMSKVLVHEIGHRVDVGTLAPGADGKDPSDAFYALSWSGVSLKLKGSRSADFVSGYAQTNRYEDFAESFVAYVFHNSDFERKAKLNKKLAKKYDFFKKTVFPEGDYAGTSFGKNPLPAYVWDLTKTPLDLARYLKYQSK